MLYGCEIWRLIEKTKRALEATDDFRSYSTIYEDFAKKEDEKRRN